MIGIAATDRRIFGRRRVSRIRLVSPESSTDNGRYYGTVRIWIARDKKANVRKRTNCSTETEIDGAIHNNFEQNRSQVSQSR